MMDDRGTPHFIYSAFCHEAEAREFGFGWFPGHDRLHAVSVPIGWRLVPQELAGCILRNVFGRELWAMDVIRKASRGEDGFRLLWTTYTTGDAE